MIIFLIKSILSGLIYFRNMKLGNEKYQLLVVNAITIFIQCIVKIIIIFLLSSEQKNHA